MDQSGNSVKQLAGALKTYFKSDGTIRTKLNGVTTYHVNIAQGTITGGSGYVPGTYDRVPMTGGSGSNMLARITVGAGGNVTDVIPDQTKFGPGNTPLPPAGYIVGDVLSASNANLGGSGSGFTWTLTRVGSDSNDGTSLATAWATMQHAALTLAQSIDINGWLLETKLEDGIYAGCDFNFYPIPNGCFWRLQGNSSDNSRVEVNCAFNGFTCIEIDDFGAVLEFRDFTVNMGTPSGSSLSPFSAFECDSPGAVMYFPNIRVIGDNSGQVAFFADCALASWFIGIQAGIFFPDGSSEPNDHPGCQIKGTFFSILELEQPLNFMGLGGPWVLESSPTWSVGFADVAADFNEITNFGGDFTYSGSVGAASPRFNFQAQCGVVTGGVGATFFPGSTSGTVNTSQAVYDGQQLGQQIVGLPTTTNLPSDTDWGVFKDTSGGGVYLAYNDAGTIKKVALT